VAIEAALADGYPEAIRSGSGVSNNYPNYGVVISLRSAAAPHGSGYLRSLDFRTGEASVHWTDEHGEWVRRAFVSRPDNVLVVHVQPPVGSTVSLEIGVQSTFPAAVEGPVGQWQRRGPQDMAFSAEASGAAILVTSRYSPEFGAKG
jgi:alpha-L-fucosidase 2